MEKLDGFSSVRLLDPSLRLPIEELVSQYEGRPWQVHQAKDLTEFACHHCAILSDGSASVFAKYSEAPDARVQFEVELAGLRVLSAQAGILTPRPIGIVAAGRGILLILEALEVVERTPLQWRQIGQTLARIHRVKSDYCGFPTNGYFGPLPQDNTPTPKWSTFYGERRLRPYLQLATDAGKIPPSLAAQIERIIRRLPELCGPEVQPSLLHGDAQQNNFISTAWGAYVIDPAVYFGHPEVDLALVDYFQPVPQDVFDGYREEMPIDPGFPERRDLWRIAAYLACVAVEGVGYVERLANAVKKYL